MNTILKNLVERYQKSTLTKSELANELGVSLSTIDKALAKGNVLPQSIKIGDEKNSSVRFNIVAVASYIENINTQGVQS